MSGMAQQRGTFAVMNAAMHQADRHQGDLAAVAVTRVIGALVALTIPLFAIRALTVFADAAGQSVAIVLAALLAALGSLTLLSIWGGIRAARISAGLLEQLRLAVFSHLVKQDLPSLRKHDRAKVLALIESDAPRIADYLSDTLANLPAHLVMMVGALIALLMIEPILAGATAALVPIFYIAIRYIGRRMRHSGIEVQERAAVVMAKASKAFAAIVPIKALARESETISDYRQALAHHRTATLDEERVYSVLGPLINLAVFAGFAAALAFTGARGMDTAEVVALLMYAGLVARPLAALSRVYGQTNGVAGALERVERALAVPEEPRNGHAASAYRINDLSVQSLDFAYRDRPPLIQGFSAKFPAGEISLLDGPNGSGKSTLLRLLMRFESRLNGQIMADGEDIAQLDLNGWRRSIGYVEQDPALFGETVLEAITMGRNCSTDTLDIALSRSGSDALVQSLPDGLDTRIGEDGIRLSGGQRQRLAIARALLDDPPILLFDEATAMLDPESEQAFMAMCRRELSDRLIVLVSHRPGTRDFVDRVVTLSPASEAQ